MSAVASTCCVICREFDGVRTPGQVHHVADGSNPRSSFMTICLCESHHVGHVGLHGMGPKKFCKLFRLPNEFYLLGLQNKYLAIDRGSR
ncbi:hypothetical protein [Nitrosomonas sp. Nm58]|uniref:hypothetical protein n=1 Tax=Nitrosomonas sp. Nm58 TaxID=200126 RepID=UPI003528893D